MKKSPKITIGPSERPQLSRDGRTMLVRIPISLHCTGGRKRVVIPAEVSSWSPPQRRVDNTMVKALVRAHRWRNMLETNLFSSVRELAKSERINESYLCRVLRLTLLSPAITEEILNGQQPKELELMRMLKS